MGFKKVQRIKVYNSNINQKELKGIKYFKVFELSKRRVMVLINFKIV